MNIKELLSIIGIIIGIYILGIYFGYKLFDLSTLEMIVIFIILCVILERL